MKRIFLIAVFLFSNLFFAVTAGASEFDELDKPPEGAHKGQMLLGLFFAFGWPYGSYIDSEKDFVSGSTYTFDNDITKKLMVTHQSYCIGISYEYMPIDYIGAGIRLSRTYLFQNTIFGSNYQNWKGTLYKDYSIHICPALHATNRKIWDFTLIPYLGYSFGEYHATPVAKQILEDEEEGKYSGSMNRKSSGFSLGAEVNCTIYFTGGPYLSLGGRWIRNYINLDKGFNLTNPQQTGKQYDAPTSGVIDTYSILLAVGFAFSR